VSLTWSRWIRRMESNLYTHHHHHHEQIRFRPYDFSILVDSSTCPDSSVVKHVVTGSVNEDRRGRCIGLKRGHFISLE
ncbi:hypothetical protein L9F63_007990, partial [Diploptera punctata]